MAEIASLEPTAIVRSALLDADTVRREPQRVGPLVECDECAVQPARRAALQRFAARLTDLLGAAESAGGLSLPSECGQSAAVTSC